MTKRSEKNRHAFRIGTATHCNTLQHTSAGPPMFNSYHLCFLTTLHTLTWLYYTVHRLQLHTPLFPVPPPLLPLLPNTQKAGTQLIHVPSPTLSLHTSKAFYICSRSFLYLLQKLLYLLSWMSPVRHKNTLSRQTVRGQWQLPENCSQLPRQRADIRKLGDYLSRRLSPTTPPLPQWNSEEPQPKFTELMIPKISWLSTIKSQSGIYWPKVLASPRARRSQCSLILILIIVMT